MNTHSYSAYLFAIKAKLREMQFCNDTQKPVTTQNLIIIIICKVKYQMHGHQFAIDASIDFSAPLG